MRILAPLLAMLAGCAAPAAAPDAPVSELPGSGTVQARLGETMRLGNLTVRPIAVLEDSRCPRDVECVWAGRLRLRTAVSGVGVGETELILSQAFALPGGGSLTLVAAAPERLQRPPPGTETGPATRFTFRRD
jgi:hypothetical protein